MTGFRDQSMSSRLNLLFSLPALLTAFLNLSTGRVSQNGGHTSPGFYCEYHTYELIDARQIMPRCWFSLE